MQELLPGSGPGGVTERCGVVAAAKTVPAGLEPHAPPERQVARGGEFVKDDRTIPRRGTDNAVAGLMQRCEQPVQRGSLHQPHAAWLNSGWRPVLRTRPA